MNKLKRLTKYLKLIPNDKIGEWVQPPKEDGVFIMPYVEYTDMVYNFMSDVGKFCKKYDLYNYDAILRKNQVGYNGVSIRETDVSDKDLQCVLAIIYGAVRAERFCEGVLLDMFQSGDIERWLTRLLDFEGKNNKKHYLSKKHNIK